LIEILFVNDLGPEKLELVTTIQHSFSELDELLNDLLDLAKLDSHHLMRLSVRFDSTEVIAGLPEGYLARQLGPVFHVLAGPEEPLFVLWLSALSSLDCNHSSFKLRHLSSKRTHLHWNEGLW
jgi:signal transduction histidine kinase